MQNLTLVLKLCSVILQFLGIFVIARLYVICLAFIFPSFTKLQEMKILSGCFKFDDLNLKNLVNQGLLLFETLKTVYTVCTVYT